ncbi:MAG: hypothetical protein E6713_02180 [Sporomusaceae bacterium]|nr:hypothetical protein [Sporomusaceae bacterium]
MLNELSTAILLEVYKADQNPEQLLADVDAFDFSRDAKSYALEVDHLKRECLIKGALVQDGPYGLGPVWANISLAHVTERGVDTLKELMLI